MKDQTKTIVYTFATIALIVLAATMIYTKTHQSIVDDPRSTEEIIKELDHQTHCEEILGGTFKVAPGGSEICEINQ